MNGKKAKYLRQLADYNGGETRSYVKVPVKRVRVGEEIITLTMLRLDPESPRALYQKLKKRYKEYRHGVGE